MQLRKHSFACILLNNYVLDIMKEYLCFTFIDHLI